MQEAPQQARRDALFVVSVEAVASSFTSRASVDAAARHRRVHVQPRRIRSPESFLQIHGNKSNGRLVTNPAAFLWPLPPNSRAMAATSTVFERREWKQRPIWVPSGATPGP